MLQRLKRLLRRASAAPAPAALSASPNDAAIVDDATLMDAHLSGWFHRESQELFEGFPISAEDSLLDIGCGDGTFVRFCAEFGAEVIFADIDAEKIAGVERSLQGSRARGIVPLVTDANPLPLPDERVNKVVAMEVLEHVEDPAQFVRELVRIGKPGAQYLITVPDALAENVQKCLAPASYFERPNHIRVFQRDEFEKLLTDAGLVVEKRAYYGFYWSIWWFFFWACKQELSPPWHPLLETWQRTWGILLSTPDGPRIKKALDEAMPKSQAIIARKPSS